MQQVDTGGPEVSSDDLGLAQLAVTATVADSAAVQSAYQPIVELSSGTVVGYEALARWPGIGKVDPESVFAAARASGAETELEWACRLAAVRGAVHAGLSTDTTLFVNIEPSLGRRGWPPTASRLRLLAEASTSLRVVLEITERALLSDPAELLAVVEWARRYGCGVAVDDVGANPHTLALLPFIDPDVVKLDRTLIQAELSGEQARVLDYALEHVERSGAVIVAEGIETERHLEQAMSLGAHLGQGWFLGRPAALVRRVPHVDSRDGTPRPATAPIEFRLAPDIPKVPSEVFARGHSRTARTKLLSALSLAIEQDALASNEPLSVLAAFQTPARFTRAVSARYEQLARTHPFVALLGTPTLDAYPAVHTAVVDADDPFADEWSIVVVGPRTAVALIAKDLHDEPGSGRRFEFVLTHDRELVVAAGRSLIRRILPS